MMSFWMKFYILSIYVLAATGQKDITKEGKASQSTTYSRYEAIRALTGPASTNWTSGCSHTGQNYPTAWWRLLFKQSVFITNVILYYRDNFVDRINGFSLFVTNSTVGNHHDTGPNGYLCYKDPNSTKDQKFIYDIECNTVGRDVVFYNEKPEAYVELCYVEVHGCPVSFHGINCTKKCHSACENQLCFPRNGTCVLGCNSGFCIQNKCEGNGTCTEGCSRGQYGQYCDLSYKNLALNRPAYYGPFHIYAAAIVDGNRSRESCIEIKSWFEVDLGEYSVVTAIYVHFIDTSSSEEKTYSIYCTNVSNSNEKLLFMGQLPSHDIAVEKKICRYVRILPPQRALQICELEVIGCKSGWYGKYCNTSCPEHCGGPCDLNTGDCIHGCKDGYTGNKCEEECENGKHGSQCLRICSENCDVSPCDHVTGNCVNGGCKPGWIGDNCTTSISIFIFNLIFVELTKYKFY